jgi:hypothetical protein
MEILAIGVKPSKLAISATGVRKMLRPCCSIPSDPATKHAGCVIPANAKALRFQGLRGK